MKKAILWVFTSFAVLVFGIGTCSSLMMNDKLLFDVNRPRSEYINPIKIQDALGQDYDYIVMAFSDIQCRDREECVKLSRRLQDLNNIASESKGKRVIFVVGDLIQYGRAEEVEEYLAMESKIRKDLDFKICGNHDIKSGLINCFRLIERRANRM